MWRVFSYYLHASGTKRATSRLIILSLIISGNTTPERVSLNDILSSHAWSSTWPLSNTLFLFISLLLHSYALSQSSFFTCRAFLCGTFFLLQHINKPWNNNSCSPRQTTSKCRRIDLYRCQLSRSSRRSRILSSHIPKVTLSDSIRPMTTSLKTSLTSTSIHAAHPTKSPVCRLYHLLHSLLMERRIRSLEDSLLSPSIFHLLLVRLIVDVCANYDN